MANVRKMDAYLVLASGHKEYIKQCIALALSNDVVFCYGVFCLIRMPAAVHPERFRLTQMASNLALFLHRRTFNYSIISFLNFIPVVLQHPFNCLILCEYDQSRRIPVQPVDDKYALPGTGN